MTELRPILQGRPTRAELRLLGSARVDVPKSGGVARIVAALGLVSGVTAKAGLSAAAASASASTSISTSAPATGVALVAKWLAIGAATGAAVVGTGEAVRFGIESRQTAPAAVERPSKVASASRAAPQPKAPLAESTTDRPIVPAPAAESSQTSSIAADRVETSPRAVPAEAVRAARDTPREPDAPAAATTHPTLSDEVSELDGTRRLLAARDPNGALRSLDDYARRFTEPRLGPEAALLRVEALVALGRKDEARRVAAPFFAIDPEGTHARRMRTLLGEGASQPAP